MPVCTLKRAAAITTTKPTLFHIVDHPTLFSLLQIRRPENNNSSWPSRKRWRITSFIWFHWLTLSSSLQDRRWGITSSILSRNRRLSSIRSLREVPIWIESWTRRLWLDRCRWDNHSPSGKITTTRRRRELREEIRRLCFWSSLFTIWWKLPTSSISTAPCLRLDTLPKTRRRPWLLSRRSQRSTMIEWLTALED